MKTYGEGSGGRNSGTQAEGEVQTAVCHFIPPETTYTQLLHQEKEVSPENVPSTLCKHTVIASTQGTPARCASSHSTKAAALRYTAHSAIGNSLAILIK
jgi:hypothetical protein